MAVPEGLSQVVRARARTRCQYCWMHESLQGATFHIEHVVPQSKGGQTILENLALACPGCNLHKGAKTTGLDPISGVTVPLFHPVQQMWAEHFRFQGYEIEGLTATGRATVLALVLNDPRRQLIRKVEETFGLYLPPPPPSTR